MLSLQIRAIGKPSERWQTEALSMYQSRLSHLCHFSEQISEIPKRSRGAQLIQRQDKELTLLTSDLSTNSYVIILDERGKQMQTTGLSQHLAKMQNQYHKLVFILGGPDGHHPGIQDVGHITLSLSQFTLPHMFARIMLYEQLYRCLTLINNHPYHRS